MCSIQIYSDVLFKRIRGLTLILALISLGILFRYLFKREVIFHEAISIFSHSFLLYIGLGIGFVGLGVSFFKQTRLILPLSLFWVIICLLGSESLGMQAYEAQYKFSYLQFFFKLLSAISFSCFLLCITVSLCCLFSSKETASYHSFSIWLSLYSLSGSLLAVGCQLLAKSSGGFFVDSSLAIYQLIITIIVLTKLFSHFIKVRQEVTFSKHYLNLQIGKRVFHLSI